MNRDSELLRTFHEKRSEPAFRALVDRHIDWLYSVALRQVGGDAHLAEDVCQEVFASVARKAETLMEFEALNGWLFKAARFSASDLVRRERRRRSKEEEAWAMNELSSNDKAALDWEAAGEFLDEAIEELGERDRDALCLRFFENRKFAQIGEELGVTENGARMRVGRALDKLSGILGRRGIRSSSSVLAAAIASHPLVSAPPGLALAAANEAVGASAAGAGMFGGFKFGSQIAWAIAASAIGVGVYQLSEYRRLNAIVEEQETTAERANERLHELERLLGTRVESDRNVHAKPVPNGRTEQSSVAGEESSLDVMERFKQAQELQEKGRLEDALAEFLWLFDNGVEERQSFVGVRLSAVLSSILDIGASIPEARFALKRRRDEIEEQILNLSPEGDREGIDVHAWAAINRGLGEGERSLHVYDRLQNDRLKTSFRIFLKRELVEAQRYSDALYPESEGMAYSNFLRRFERQPSNDYDEDRRESIIARHKSAAIRNAAADLELLAGAGQIDEALKLAEEVLVRDSSAETVGLLRTHLERAGRSELLTLLSEQYVSD